MIPVQLIAQKSERSIFTSLKISEMSLTILSYMHVLCRRADLVKKSTFLGIISSYSLHVF